MPPIVNVIFIISADGSTGAQGGNETAVSLSRFSKLYLLVVMQNKNSEVLLQSSITLQGIFFQKLNHLKIS